MDLQPDARWRHIVGGVDGCGSPRAMALVDLRKLTDSWTSHLAGVSDCGPTALLERSRSLVVQSWFDYGLLVQASLVALQAVEATFRQFVYPESGKRSFRRLVDQAEQDGVLPADVAELIRAGVELRNVLSHPGGTTTFTLGLAASIIERAHQIVATIWLAAAVS